MSNLKKQILDLQKISEALEPSEAERTNYVNDVSAYANSFINNLETAKAFVGAKETPMLFHFPRIRKHYLKF